jgi:hypothetical protein
MQPQHKLVGRVGRHLQQMICSQGRACSAASFFAVSTPPKGQELLKLTVLACRVMSCHAVCAVAQVNNDVTLSTSTNIATKATKAGITYHTKVRGVFLGGGEGVKRAVFFLLYVEPCLRASRTTALSHIHARQVFAHHCFWSAPCRQAAT